jgi:hypothetical protein
MQEGSGMGALKMTYKVHCHLLASIDRISGSKAVQGRFYDLKVFTGV